MRKTLTLTLVLLLPCMQGGLAAPALPKAAIWIKIPITNQSDVNCTTIPQDAVSWTRGQISQSVGQNAVESITPAKASNNCYIFFSIRPEALTGIQGATPEKPLGNLGDQLSSRWGEKSVGFTSPQSFNPDSVATTNSPARTQTNAGNAPRTNHDTLTQKKISRYKAPCFDGNSCSSRRTSPTTELTTSLAQRSHNHQKQRAPNPDNKTEISEVPLALNNPAPPNPPNITGDGPAASLDPIDKRAAGFLARTIRDVATKVYRGNCYRGVLKALDYFLTPAQKSSLPGDAAYQFAEAVNNNPHLFASKLRRLTASEILTDTNPPKYSPNNFPVGAIVIYGRTLRADDLYTCGVSSKHPALQKLYGRIKDGGVCGFSRCYGHSEIIAQVNGKLVGCSAGYSCRSIPKKQSEGSGSLQCIFKEVTDQALTSPVNVYVPVGEPKSPAAIAQR